MLLENIPPSENPFSSTNLFKPTLLSLLSGVGYGTLHFITHRYLVSGEVLERIKNRSDRLYFTEKFFSTLNGLVLGVAGSSLFLSGVFSGSKGVFGTYPSVLDYVFSSYVGYSLYDMVMMLLVGNEPFAMWAHHVIGAAGAYLTMIYRGSSFFPTMFTITELTVVPANIVWILRRLGYENKSPAMKVALDARMLSFLLLRTFLAPATVAYMWYQLDGNSSVEKLTSLSDELGRLPLPVVIGTVFNVALLGSLNLWWSLLLIKGVITRMLKKKAGKDS